MNKLSLTHYRLDGMVLDSYESNTKKRYVDGHFHRTYYELIVNDRILKIYDNGDIHDEKGNKI